MHMLTLLVHTSQQLPALITPVPPGPVPRDHLRGSVTLGWQNWNKGAAMRFLVKEEWERKEVQSTAACTQREVISCPCKNRYKYLICVRSKANRKGAYSRQIHFSMITFKDKKEKRYMKWCRWWMWTSWLWHENPLQHNVSGVTYSTLINGLNCEPCTSCQNSFWDSCLGAPLGI